MADTETQGAGEYERPQDAQKSAKDFVRRWVATLELASEEEKAWRKDAEEASKVYVSDEASLVGTAFNIFHANIETICPSLYNSTPLPDIRRRYGDRDPQAKAVADALQRCLSYSIDQYDFDSLVSDTVQDMAVTGRGVMRVLYEPQEVESDMTDPETGEPVTDIGAQVLRCQTVPWASFRRGPGRTWHEVEWVAFAHYMTRTEMERISPVHGAKVTLDTLVSDKGEQRDAAADTDNPEASIFRRALVWEIWDREARKVRFIAPSYGDDQLMEADDPLGLKGFYPMPRPMMTARATGGLVPLTPYRVQKPLLSEIDILSRRITKLVRQLRPRALGPSDVDMEALASAEDGEIVGVANVIQYLEGGGMDKMLAWFPLEPTIKAVEQLYIQREQAKQALFEVSGLADIMRGSSKATETLGAQQIKQQWGSLRIQKGQAEVQRFVRDIFRIKAELIAEKFTPQNIAQMSGVEMDGKAIQLMTTQNMRDYRIDIETDSTIKGDLTRNMENMTQFVGGSAQYFAAVAPVVESGAISKVAAITIYSAFARNFRLGKEVDAVLDSLVDEATKMEEQQQQQGPPPDPEMVKAEMEIKVKQAELEIAKEKAAADMQTQQQKAQLDLQIAQMEMEIAKAKAQLEMQIAQQKAEQDYQVRLMDMQGQQQQAQMDAQNRQREADQKLETSAMLGNQQLRHKEQQAKLAAKAKPKAA